MKYVYFAINPAAVQVSNNLFPIHISKQIKLFKGLEILIIIKSYFLLCKNNILYNYTVNKFLTNREI